MARTYRVEEIAQLFGKQLVANATYQIGTAGTSKAPGQTIRVNGISARAETTIASGGQVLLVKSGSNWFAYGQEANEIRTQTRSRRRRLQPTKESGDITILYRVDLEEESQLWILESGQKVLLGTYPVVDHSFNATTLATHAGGVRDLSADGYSLLGFENLDTAGIQRPYDAQASVQFPGGGADLGSVGTTIKADGPLSNSANSISDNIPSYSGSTNVNNNLLESCSASNSSMGRTVALSNGRVFFVVPPGNYERYNLTLNLSQSGSGNARYTATILVGDFLIYPPESSQRTLSLREESATVDLTIFPDGPEAAEMPWRRNSLPHTVSLLSTGAGAFSAPQDASAMNSATGSADITLDRYRPSGYLSKDERTRFVGVFYLAADGSPKTDYYEVSANLSFTKTTWDYTDPVAPSRLDMQRSLLTFNYDDFIFDSGNPYWNRAHLALAPDTKTSNQNTYNIERNGDVTVLTSFSNANTNPNLVKLIANELPEADRILWVAALPREARRIDPGGHTVTNFPLKQS